MLRENALFARGGHLAIGSPDPDSHFRSPGRRLTDMKILIAITEIWRAGAASYATGETATDGQLVFAREVEKIIKGTLGKGRGVPWEDLVAMGAAVPAD